MSIPKPIFTHTPPPPKEYQIIFDLLKHCETLRNKGLRGLESKHLEIVCAEIELYIAELKSAK